MELFLLIRRLLRVAPQGVLPNLSCVHTESARRLNSGMSSPPIFTSARKPNQKCQRHFRDCLHGNLTKFDMLEQALSS